MLLDKNQLKFETINGILKITRAATRKQLKKQWIENLVIKQVKRLNFDDELIEKLVDTIMKL